MSNMTNMTNMTNICIHVHIVHILHIMYKNMLNIFNMLNMSNIINITYMLRKATLVHKIVYLALCPLFLELGDMVAIASLSSVSSADRKSTRLNSSHRSLSRMPSSA